MIRRLHRVNDATQPGGPPACGLLGDVSFRPRARQEDPLGPQAALRLLQTCVQTLGRVQDGLPAWLCPLNMPSAKPPPRPPPASAPAGREQGVPRGGSLHRTRGLRAWPGQRSGKGDAANLPWGVPRYWGDPATLRRGTPSSEGSGAAVAQHPLVCRAAGPPPGSADSRSSAKTSVCQCPSLQPTDNFTGVWKALLKLTKHCAVYPSPTLANCASKASWLPHPGSPGCDRPPLTHGWHAFSAHLYAATITHKRKIMSNNSVAVQLSKQETGRTN